jgi:peptidoglycan/xylan/chitin deacetylase (PgdA/CDA1 family)
VADHNQFNWQRMSLRVLVLGLVVAAGSWLVINKTTSLQASKQTLALKQTPDNGFQTNESAQQVQGLRNLNTPLAAPVNPESLDFSVPRQFQGKTIYGAKLKSEEKVIALTFDDGPYPLTTLKVLDILKQNNIKATFFWVGAAVKQYPQIANAVVASGEAIGNHTWHHWYKNMDSATATHEIDDTAAIIYKTTGVKTSIFRPPGGFLHNGVANVAKKEKDAVVMWSVSSADTDWHAQPQAFVNNVLKGAKPGSIVLMHDGGGNHTKTVKALPQIIAGLKQRGYQFVTVPELLKMQKS